MNKHVSEVEYSNIDKEIQSDGEEVVFRECVPDAEGTAPHTASSQMVTTEVLQDIIEGWIRAVQLASEKCSAHIDNLQRDSRAREGVQERRTQEIRIAMRARDEHTLHAVRSTVQTSSRL